MNIQTISDMLNGVKMIANNDDQMTDLIYALEEKNFSLCIKLAEEMMRTSDIIEQRFAAMFIRDLSKQRDNKLAMYALEEVYAYDRVAERKKRKDLAEKKSLAKLMAENRRVHESFNAATERFIVTMDRIQKSLKEPPKKKQPI